MNENSLLKINEVSRLYNIGIDSLRYYERIGLLTPKRGAVNNYRYYDYEDLMKLNLILEMRKCGFQFTQIREMFGSRDLKSTLDLLNQELNILDREILKMQESKKAIRHRINSLITAKADLSDNHISIKKMPERKCLHIIDKDVTTDEIDYYITDFMKKHGIAIENMIGRFDGYRLDSENAVSPERYMIKEVFIVNNFLSVEPSFSLPEGNYLSLAYNGISCRSKIWGDKIFQYAREHSIELIGDLFEFAVIDYYETDIPQEYVTLLQIQVK